MATQLEGEFLNQKMASVAYGRDKRTLKKWAREGRIRCLLIGGDEGKQPVWMFESPSALYARQFGGSN